MTKQVVWALIIVLLVVGALLYLANSGFSLLTS